VIETPVPTRVARAQPPGRRMTFAELVHHHYEWRQNLEDPAAQLRYEEALARFEAEQGQIVDAYWCKDIESAVAMTLGHSVSRGPSRVFRVPRFHRVSDWATRDQPEVAHLLHECDEIAVRARETLSPKNQRICLQLVLACAGHLLAVVDTPAGGRARTLTADALDTERAEVQAVRRYYRDAANGDAQMVYFLGMGMGAVVLLGLALLGRLALSSANIDRQLFFVAVAGGALGALVSVIARVNDGTFALDYDVRPLYSLFTGALRPVIGSLFGLVIYAAITSGLLSAFKLPADHTERFYFVGTLAFLAGFSERWAQDTLTEVAPAARTPGKTPAEHKPAGPSDSSPPE
jgi:hypothetical protein